MNRQEPAAARPPANQAGHRAAPQQGRNLASPAGLLAALALLPAHNLVVVADTLRGAAGGSVSMRVSVGQSAAERWEGI